LGLFEEIGKGKFIGTAPCCHSATHLKLTEDYIMPAELMLNFPDPTQVAVHLLDEYADMTSAFAFVNPLTDKDMEELVSGGIRHRLPGGT